MSGTEMRAFLAFELDPEVVGRLLEAQEEIKKIGADLSIVGRENLHLTVKFLGEVPESTAEEIDRRIATLDLRKLEASIRGVGAFPDLRRPRVVWAGTASGDEPEVIRRAEAIIAALKGIGQDENRDFHAHVTLARVKSPRNNAGLADFITRNSGRNFGKTRIDALKLKSSTLTPKGPIYTEIREYALR
jgi:RNA 2',3'-cyclic 3'-phosphodiesterase